MVIRTTVSTSMGTCHYRVCQGTASRELTSMTKDSNMVAALLLGLHGTSRPPGSGQRCSRVGIGGHRWLLPDDGYDGYDGYDLMML